MLFTKLTKPQVLKKMRELKDGGTFSLFLCPSKCYPSPGHPFNMAIEVEASAKGVYRDGYGWTSLDVVVNDFAYYNCTHETGIRTHFYLEGKNAK